MKKIIALILICMCCFCGCDIGHSKELSTTGRVAEATVNSDKLRVVEMCMKYGEYDNGAYRISKTTNQGDVYFTYTFSYEPATDFFICYSSCTTYTDMLSVYLYDFGGVVFSWEAPESRYYSGVHRLCENSNGNIVAEIKFEWPASNPIASAYTVTSNTYSQLDKAGMNEYAQTCYECIEQGFIYAQGLVNAYVGNITLR